jgi:hypothetical protein
MSSEPMAQRLHDCGEAFPSDVSELAAVGLTPVASRCVAPPRILDSPVAFECVLHEKLEAESRYVFIGRIAWLAARDGLIHTKAWRVNLRDYHPVARFGASFYTRTNERFSLASPSDKPDQRAPTSTSIDEISAPRAPRPGRPEKCAKSLAVLGAFVESGSLRSVVWAGVPRTIDTSI